MNHDVHHQEKRLRRIFGRALIVALATPACVPFACTSTGNAGRPSAGGSDAGIASGGATPASTTGPTTTSSSGGAASTGSTSVSGGGGGAGGGTAASSSGGGGAAASSSGGGDAGAPEDAGVDCGTYVFSPIPPDSCGTYVRLPCGLPAGTTPGTNCYLYLADCAQLCPNNSFFNCHAVNQSCTDAGVIVPDPAGGVDLDCSICANGVGRVPAGLARARRVAAPTALGSHFAAAAHLEQASVHAFRRLHGELATHGAPAKLLRASRRAERDEVRHARLMARMARRFGGCLVPPRVAAVGARALDTVAIENAVEGCVRETFGALVASFQARNAGDPAIARLMESIARDETRHAALSWSVARWASRRLDAQARASLTARSRDAVRALRRETRAGLDGELQARAGLPVASQRLALLDTLEAELWGTN